jgi:hypothetical protein
MNGVRNAGFDKRTAIIASVLPLASVEKARELQKTQTYGPVPESVIARMGQSARPAREGVEIAVDVAMRLKEVPEIRGIHVLNGGSDSLIGEVIRKVANR